jgi:hypothetical protein
MRSYWSRVSPKTNEWHLYKKANRNTKIQERQSCKDRNWNYDSTCQSGMQEPLESARDKEGFFLTVFRGSLALMTQLSQTLNLQNTEKISFIKSS